ncbi:glycosyl transferase family protein [Enterobacter hormaechei]|uniref:glycosyltransferase n=1 Tax=Enterobacter hormaechei TaxID=158836 RepID=UPI000F6BDB0A|nr:glycosyltransferase [Enterobacter hormaechei]VEB15592.1 glycosyl transferase family protein [Enterobacter hormaechei]
MEKKLPPFSLLMAVYSKDNPEYFNDAFESIAANTLLPDEIVLVEDGPLNSSLEEVVSRWSQLLNVIIVPLKENVGLGAALNKGISYCRNEIIIRADADDLNRKYRFLMQVEYLYLNPDIDILSGWVEEFNIMPGDKGKVRKVPSNSHLIEFSKKRCPFNHPAVAFRKNIIISVGGYKNEHLYEDYALWMRVLNAGYKGDNLPEILVDMRFSDEALNRRGGFKYAVSEIKSQWVFYRRGYINILQFARNIVFRAVVRMLPNRFRVFFYKRLLRG